MKNDRKRLIVIITAAVLLAVFSATAVYLFIVYTPRYTDECIISSSQVVHDGVLYKAEYMQGIMSQSPDGTDEAKYVCGDPLCTHDNGECPTYSCGRQVALCDEGGDTVMYFTHENLTVKTENSTAVTERSFDIRYYNINTGKVKTICRGLPLDPTEIILCGDMIYFNMLNLVNDGDGGSYSTGMGIYSVSRRGGKYNVLCVKEDVSVNLLYIKDGYYYYYEDGCINKTGDFVSSETVIKSNSEIALFDGDYLYFAANERKPGFDLIKEGIVPADIRGVVTEYSFSCVDIYRKNLTKNGADAEFVIGGIRKPYFNGVAGGGYLLISDGVLYAVPLSYRYVGSFRWMQIPMFSGDAVDDSLSTDGGGEGFTEMTEYVVSETGGNLIAVDLQTLESRQVLTDCGYDIDAIHAVYRGKYTVTGRPYDLTYIQQTQSQYIKDGVAYCGGSSMRGRLMPAVLEGAE